MVFGPILEQLQKFIKNLILIGISSNFLNNISTCICIRKNYKKNSVGANFDEIPCSIAHGIWLNL